MSAYADILARQAPMLDALLDLLRQEQTLLMAPTVDGPELERLAGDKSDYLSTLQTLEDDRLVMLEAMGLGMMPVEQQTAAMQTNCLPLWETVHSAARQAQHLNQLNGILINKRLQHNQKVLNTLRELASAPVYDADGQARRVSSLRTSA